VDGRLLAAAARGVLVVDGDHRELAGESLRIEGALSGDFKAAPGLLPAAVAAPPTKGEFSGDASLVSVGGTTIVREPGARALVGAGVIAGLALFGLAFLKSVGLAPFYTRIDRATVLRNPNRASVLEAVKSEPSITAAGLMRRVGLSEVVVRHHLRMLEAHRHVVSRRRGRSVGYFPADGPLASQHHDAAMTLRDRTRRDVATLLALAPLPLTQKEIAHRMGHSQRLVSYHLVRLEASGLVIGEGTMPRRYRAAQTLGRVLPEQLSTAAG
jgi:DNA-binding transcriptional ArsR family regulator